MCCPPRAPISEQDLFGIYREFVQLRQERQECELNPRDACLALPFSPSPAPIKPPRANNKLEGNTTLDLQSLSAPQRPPGVFLKSRSRDSLQTVSTIATLTGDIEDSLVSNATAAAVDVKGNPCEEAPGAAKSGSEVQCDLRMEHLGKDGHRKVIWHVHASKLRSKDQQIISSTFEIAGCCFKLMLKPTPMGDKKGQACFKKAKGWGSVDLKMVEGVAVAPTLCFCVSVGEGSTRRPVQHDFNNSSVGSLPREDQKFDFTSAVDHKSSTFAVHLELFPSM